MAVTASALTNTFSAPGVLLSENFADLLETQMEDVAQRSWNVELQGESLFKTRNTNKDHIIDSYVTGLGLMVRNSDEEQLPIDHLIQGYDKTHTPVDYRLSVRVTKKLRETDQYEVIANTQRSLADSAKCTLEYIMADAFNTGFGTNAQWLTADGLYLFDSGRNPEDPGEAQWSNLESAAALTAASLETMRVNFRKTLNERGLTTPLTQRKLVIPPDLEKKAWELTESEGSPEDALRRSNFHRSMFTVKVWDYLTSTTAWYGATDVDSLYELFLVKRVNPEVTTFPLGNNPDVIVHRARMSVTTGANRPHSLRGNVGA